MMYSDQNKDKRLAFRNSIRDKQIKNIFRRQRFVLQIASNMAQGQRKQNNIFGAWSQIQAKILNFRYCQQVQKEAILNQIAKLSDYIGLNENLQKAVSILDFLIKTVQVQNGNIMKCCLKVLEQIMYNIKKGAKILQNNIFETLIQALKLKILKQTSTSIDLLSLINCIIYKSPEHGQVFYQQQFVLKLLQILQNNTHQYSSSDFETVQSLIFRLLKSSNLDKLQQWQVPFLKRLVFIQISCKWSQHQDLFRISLKILATLASSNNQNVLHILWMCQGLVPSLLKLTIHTQPVIRSIVVSVLANLTTTNNRNSVLQYLSLCNNLQDNHRQCINSSLKLLSNIVATSIESANFVFQHKIFKDVIINFANQPQYHKNCIDAIFILSTLIFYDRFDFSLQLIARPDYQIFKLLTNAVCIPYAEASFYIDVISAFIKILSILKIVDYQAYLQVIEFLQNAGLETKLLEVQQSVGNKEITKLITILLEQINSYD